MGYGPPGLRGDAPAPAPKRWRTQQMTQAEIAEPGETREDVFEQLLDYASVQILRSDREDRSLRRMIDEFKASWRERYYCDAEPPKATARELREKFRTMPRSEFFQFSRERG